MSSRPPPGESEESQMLLNELPAGRLKFVAPLLALLALLAAPAAAQEPPLKVDREPVMIDGRLGGNTTSFSRIVRVELRAGTDDEKKTLTILRDDLRGETGVIDRSQVETNPQTATLTKGQPIEVTIKVNNVTRPGLYTGQVLLRLQGVTPDKSLPVHLDIKSRVDVKVVPTPMAANFTRCSPVPCTCPEWMPRVLCLGSWLPAYMVGNTRVLGQLDNQTPAPVEITAKDILLHGTSPSAGINTDALKLVAPSVVEPFRAEDIKLNVGQLNDLPAGRYSGSVRLSPADADPITTGLTLDVRDGPVYALLVLVVGILFGRLMKSMATAEAQMQVKLFPRVRALRDRIESVREQGISSLLNRELTRIERRVNEAAEPEQTLSQALSALSAKVEFFISIESLLTELEDPVFDAVRDEATARLREAAGKRLNGDDAGAAETLRAVEVLMAQVKQADPAARLESVGAAPKVIPGEAAPPGRTVRLLSMLAGVDVDTNSAEFRFRVLRPLLFFALLILLVLLGLESQYLSKVNFGADGLFDYVTLFLWGISAEVINSTLQGLPARRRP
jgi:hypothetical protein